MASWPRLRQRIVALSAAANDESEPYKTKYEALSLLADFCAAAEVAQVLSPEAEGAREAVGDVLAQARLHQGVLHVQTEENSAGERELLQGVRWVERRLLELLKGTQLAALPAIEASCSAIEGCNFLALVYSGWDEPARSLRYLRTAKAVFRAAVRRMSCAPDADVGSSDPLRAASKSLDSLFTHVLFYYAQIYGKLGAAAIAAGYIEQTLLQLLLRR